MDHVKHASKKQEVNIKAYIYIEKKKKKKSRKEVWRKRCNLL